jgi:lysophospholipase L1-like esterase
VVAKGKIDAGTYLALGDSYSSGEGLEPFLPGAELGCNRSPFAYPLLLRFETEANPSSRIPTVFRACSGAVTTDIHDGIVGGAAAQTAQPIDTTVTLVTITIGGNNVRFSDIVAQCMLRDACQDATYQQPSPILARPGITYPATADFGTWAEEAIEKHLVPQLAIVYDGLRAKYPEARIVVIGYPYLFPTGGAPLNPFRADCMLVLNRVDEAERDALKALGQKLNDALFTQAYDSGVEYVSPEYVWQGHEPCGSDGGYTNAILPVLKLKAISGGSFHPNVPGQQALARLVACYLNNFAEPQEDPEKAGAYVLPGDAPGSIAAGDPCTKPSGSGS